MPTVDPVSSSTPSTAPADLNSLIGGVPSTAPVTRDPNTFFDKDMFLKLLVAQMRYQNPMEPTDPSAFMAQASQLASVEQLQSIAKSQAEATQWQRNLAAASLVGRQVTGTDAAGMPVTGVVDRITITAGVPSAVIGRATVEVSAITSIEAPKN